MDNGVTLRGFLEMVRRRKWVVLTVFVLLPLVAVAVSSQQAKLYQSTARVLLSSQNLANQLTGGPGTGIIQEPDRIAETQAGVARTSAVAGRVLARVSGTGLTPGGFLAESGVSPNPNADILIFEVTDRNPALAERLVNEYATQYTVYRHQLDNAPIVLARNKLKTALSRLVAQGGGHSRLYTDLLSRDQTLAEMEALQTWSATVIQQGSGASQIQPRPKRNALLALVLGLILGLAFAYLWETLDTRVRNTDDVGKYLGGLPLLARLPTPGKRGAQPEGRLVMMEEPDGLQAQAFRMLRTNLEFVMLDREIRTIMVTSATEDEGKSTTIANLAVALARSGQRVALVDLDLRRPSLDKFFRLHGPGVTQVALGHVALDQALVRIATPSALAQRNHRGGQHLDENGTGSGYGSLQVLPAGEIPPDRGAFFDSQALTGILEVLRQQVDVVLIDAPPVLEVGDALTLSRKVDGIVVVARINIVRRPMLHELARLLAMTPARVLGFIATGAGKEAVPYGYRAPTIRASDEPGGLQIEVGGVAR